MKNILENNKLFIKKRENFLEEKGYRSLITISLSIILALTLLGFSSFFVYKFYQYDIQKEQKEKIISSLEKDIEKLQGLVLKSSKVDKVDKAEVKRINKEFANKKFVFGLETTTVDILDKTRATGALKYFDIKVHFKTKDLDAIKRYVALIYLNDKVYKIIDIDKDHLKLIILGV